MIITDEKITVTLEMLQQNNMTRGENEVGIPTQEGELEWKSFDDLTERDFDAIENYFIKAKGEGG